jgi:hypothetical protein
MMTMGMPTDKASIACLLSSLRASPHCLGDAGDSVQGDPLGVPTRRMIAHRLAGWAAGKEEEHERSTRKGAEAPRAC